jgi:hypothetical protein
MDYLLKFTAKENADKIEYQHNMMLVGSCFTEHIGHFLTEHKFKTLQNPHGILFDTLSVSRSITTYIENKKIPETDSFQYNELWQNWQFHSQFSHPDKAVHLAKINQSIEDAHQFLKTTQYLMITLGSSFAYQLVEPSVNNAGETKFVANCHKAPRQWFDKYLIPIEEQIASLDNVIHRLKMLNPSIKIIFTISPVRHIRDGVVENNRSKARLLEVVHHLVQKFNGLYYFPAYEMVIDVLRDYRFYDIDMVHPNYAATQYVIKAFCTACLSNEANHLLEEIKPVITAFKHKAFHPDSVAHKKFLLQNYETVKRLKLKYQFLDFEREMNYFGDTVV